MEQIYAGCQEHKLDCLARHFCRMPTKDDRHRLLAAMRKNQSPEFMTDLEARIYKEWNVMYPKASSSLQEATSGNA